MVLNLDGAMPTYNEIVDRDGRWVPHFSNALRCTLYVRKDHTKQRTEPPVEQRNTVALMHPEPNPHDGKAWFGYSMHLGRPHGAKWMDVHPKNRTDKHEQPTQVRELSEKEINLSVDELTERYPYRPTD
jgi:hypothetical protein